MDEKIGTSGRIGQAFGAIFMGLFVALLGYVAAFAEGMSSAPSPRAGAIAMLVLALGLILCALGLVSLWWRRLRPAAARLSLIAAGLLVLAFVAEKLVLAVTGG